MPDVIARVLDQAPILWELLSKLATLDLPDWYLGAGCIAQTFWNAEHGYPVEFGIKDYDVVYFDVDLSQEAEATTIARVEDSIGDLPVRLDIKNQARVHHWYAIRFGYPIRAYTSCADSIASWPTTATAVGLSLKHGTLTVEAPFGVTDLTDLVVRPNRVQITRSIYSSKVERWTQLWPMLRVLDWDDGVGTVGERWAV